MIHGHKTRRAEPRKRPVEDKSQNQPAAYAARLAVVSILAACRIIGLSEHLARRGKIIFPTPVNR